jgi:transcriptional regulator with XRE-family HTH domain
VAEISLETLIAKLKQKRGAQGIRVTADQIGISPATLSRVERGNLPDLETFSKICEWVGVDPAVVLGFRHAADAKPIVRVHFKKEMAVSTETAQALSELIMKAKEQMEEEEGL